MRNQRPEGPPKDYPDDFSLDEARRQAFDALEGRGNTFHIHQQPKRDPLTIGVALFAVIAQVALWVWWSGRMSQRVDQIEYAQQQQQRMLEANNERDNRQDITLGIVGQQYGEIGRRLENIDRKMDRR